MNKQPAMADVHNADDAKTNEIKTISGSCLPKKKKKTRVQNGCKNDHPHELLVVHMSPKTLGQRETG